MHSTLAAKEYSYFEVKKILNNFNARFPFLEPINIGKSVAGRDILGLKLGKSSEYILYMASFSGFDTKSTLFILHFLEEFCSCLYTGEKLCGVDIRKATFKKGIIFLPILNPDSYELKIKGLSSAGHLKNMVEKTDFSSDNYPKNLRGVNLKYNFYKSNALIKTDTFGGYSPLSEPESIAIASLLRKEKIREVLSLNTLGRSGIYFKDISGKGLKIAEVFAAVSGLSININNNPSLPLDFKTWVANEIKKPCFEIVQPTENYFSAAAAYTAIKELLTLFALM